MERFLAEDEADKDIIILTYLIQTLNEITFVSSGFSTVVAWISKDSDINSTDRRKQCACRRPVSYAQRPSRNAFASYVRNIKHDLKNWCHYNIRGQRNRM